MALEDPFCDSPNGSLTRDYNFSDPGTSAADPEDTSRLEAVALKFDHLIRCLWKLQLVRSRFSAYGQYLQDLEKSGRGLLLDILSNYYPSAENQGRKPKQLRDRRLQPLRYAAFERFNFWGERAASDVPAVGSSSSSSQGWQQAD